MGIAMVPVYAAIEELKSGRLVRILPDYVLQKMDNYAVYASRRHMDAKIRSWIDLLRTWIPEATARDEQTLLELEGKTANKPRLEAPLDRFQAGLLHTGQHLMSNFQRGGHSHVSLPAL
jgi:hypothetical protein